MTLSCGCAQLRTQVRYREQPEKASFVTAHGSPLLGTICCLKVVQWVFYFRHKLHMVSLPFDEGSQFHYFLAKRYLQSRACTRTAKKLVSLCLGFHCKVCKMETEKVFGE